MIGPGIKRGTAGLAVLSVPQDGPLHGYELARRIEQQSNGALRFTLAALYPMPYRMEQQRLIRGSWETSANGRRRRCYRLTPAGKKRPLPFMGFLEHGLEANARSVFESLTNEPFGRIGVVTGWVLAPGACLFIGVLVCLLILRQLTPRDIAGR